MAERYLSVKEYAALVGVHRLTVYRWIALCRWPDADAEIHRLGRTIRIRLVVANERIHAPTSDSPSTLTH
jgi:hypothetical protein